MNSVYIADSPCFYTSEYTDYSTDGTPGYHSHFDGYLSWGYEFSERKTQGSFFKRGEVIRDLESYHHLDLKIDEKGVVKSDFFRGFAPNESSKQALWLAVERIMVERDGELYQTSHWSDWSDNGAP